MHRQPLGLRTVRADVEISLHRARVGFVRMLLPRRARQLRDPCAIVAAVELGVVRHHDGRAGRGRHLRELALAVAVYREVRRPTREVECGAAGVRDNERAPRVLDREMYESVPGV